MTGAKIIAQAKKYLGYKWGTFCRAYGFNYAVAWCCIWVWYQFRKAKAAKLFYGGGKVCNCRVAWNWCRANLKHIKMADAKPGDIVFFTWTGRGNNAGNGALSIDHIGLIERAGSSQVAHTIEGNTGGGTPATNKVMKRDRARKWILGIYRPKYKASSAAKKASAKSSTTKKVTYTSKVATHAKKRALEHHKYKVSGWSWTTGIECHGLTGMVYKECGYESIYKRIRKKGFWRKFDKADYLGPYKKYYIKKGIPASKLLPGDIVYTSRVSHHSAIYIGDGKVAEAVGSGTRVAKLGKRFRWAFRVKGVAVKKTVKKTTKKARVWPELPKRGYFKMGDKGVNVKRLQRLLKKAKYNCGSVDGTYGSKTAGAVRKLQRKYKTEYNLAVDGCCNKKTIQALKKALK